MIRAIRPAAMAQDDAAMIAGWNVSPNLAYTLVLIPGETACAALLHDEDGSVLLASGAALTGTAQPCVLTPYTGGVGMVDADLGWHLRLTTLGTESPRTIRIGPAVDLPDEIHPVYQDRDMAVAKAAAAINATAHYVDESSVRCPHGLGASLGQTASATVDGQTMTGQIESVTWSGTANGATETALIRTYVSIAPEPFEDPAFVEPPDVTDDTGETDAATATSGNVLTNDESGLTVVAVNGLAANVGAEVAGDNGGVFVIESDGSWTFDPDGDFADLEGEETEETSVTYHASDGVSEAMATLTVTVTAVSATPMTIDGTNFTIDGTPVTIG